MRTDIASLRLPLWLPALVVIHLGCPGPEPGVPEPALPESVAREDGACDPKDPDCPRRCEDIFPNPGGPLPPQESRCAETAKTE